MGHGRRCARARSRGEGRRTRATTAPAGAGPGRYGRGARAAGDEHERGLHRTKHGSRGTATAPGLHGGRARARYRRARVARCDAGVHPGRSAAGAGPCPRRAPTAAAAAQASRDRLPGRPRGTPDRPRPCVGRWPRARPRRDLLPEPGLHPWLDRPRGARRHRPDRRRGEPRRRCVVHGSSQPAPRARAHARRPGDHLDQPRRRDTALRPDPRRARSSARARQLDRGGRGRGPRQLADRGRVRAHRRARRATAPRGHARHGHPRLRGRRARGDDRRRAVAVMAMAADGGVPPCRSPARQLDHGRSRADRRFRRSRRVLADQPRCGGRRGGATPSGRPEPLVGDAHARECRVPRLGWLRPARRRAPHLSRPVPGADRTGPSRSRARLHPS